MHSINSSEATGSELNVVEVNKNGQQEQALRLRAILENINKARYSLEDFRMWLFSYAVYVDSTSPKNDVAAAICRKGIIAVGELMTSFADGLELVNIVVKEYPEVQAKKLVLEGGPKEGSPEHMAGLLELHTKSLVGGGSSLEEGLGEVRKGLMAEDILSATKEMGLLFERCKPVADRIQLCLCSSRGLVEPGSTREGHLDAASENITRYMKSTSNDFDKRNSDLLSVDGPSHVLEDTYASQEYQPEVHRM